MDANLIIEEMIERAREQKRLERLRLKRMSDEELQQALSDVETLNGRVK